jgi:hypothetical protein
MKQRHAHEMKRCGSLLLILMGSELSVVVMERAFFHNMLSFPGDVLNLLLKGLRI